MRESYFSAEKEVKYKQCIHYYLCAIRFGNAGKCERDCKRMIDRRDVHVNRTT